MARLRFIDKLQIATCSSNLLQYFHKVIGQLLPLAYNLLKRNLFAEIIEAHLANRMKENVDQLAA